MTLLIPSIVIVLGIVVTVIIWRAPVVDREDEKDDYYE
jgi:hypothetical protein